jgi:Protein of unknown function (DUF1573)
MEKKYKIVLLTVLTLSVLAIAIVELTGISDHSLGWWKDHRNGEVSLYDRNNNRSYHGEIYPDQTKTRDEIVHDMPKTTMQFYETRYSFGEVSQGKVVKHSFRFKNTGENPLMIAKTDVTCGCTVTGFPDEPVAPGQEGDLTVEFNTAGKTPMYYEKPVVVHSNAVPEAVTVKIDATVK